MQATVMLQNKGDRVCIEDIPCKRFPREDAVRMNKTVSDYACIIVSISCNDS